jgi:peptidoglycan/LPS O-acetylase OafA/YrhL
MSQPQPPVDRAAYLDGIRALAALGVVASHSGVPGPQLNRIGVQVFFVLSGYLITGILRRGIESNTLRVGTFLLARLRRLMPALVLMLTVCTLLAWGRSPAFGSQAALWAVASLFYITDVARIFSSVSDFFGHTWTLSVEAQFYLVWPFVLRLMIRTGHGLVILALLTIGCASLYPLTRDMHPLIEVNPAPLLVGAGLAFVRLPSMPWLAGPLSWRPLATVGLLSYGIYLWHFPILWFLSSMEWPIRFSVALGLSVLLSAASYLTVERWAGCAKAPLRWA